MTDDKNGHVCTDQSSSWLFFKCSCSLAYANSFHPVPECTAKTNELLKDKCSRMESKRKKLLRSQSKEKSTALEVSPADCDPQQLTEVGALSLPIHNSV